MQGEVIKSTGKWYKVMLKDGSIVQAAVKGKLRLAGLKTTNPIAAGDVVNLTAIKTTSETIHTIQSVESRKNYLVRKSTNLSKQMQIIAANVDRVYLIVTLKSPETQVAFIDRFLVAAESFRIPTTILFNKVDVYGQKEEELMFYLTEIYEKLGYPCHHVIAENAKTIHFLKEEISRKKVMISGNSGVGKTTLVNSLDPNLKLRVGEISRAHEQGKHTTTFSEMHALESGGYIIDTPGIRAFGLVDLEKEHYAHYFPEMRALLGACKFHNCRHLEEPKCAIKEAVEEEKIAGSRYLTYLQLMSEDGSESYRKNDFK
ncbi:MAG: ribosome small subunit-dependent GTPase A [Crocinitomicaceae bacterium]|nr:ribosome small subunit-dependent GTPase A [Crocinitomicaceae bacterium]